MKVKGRRGKGLMRILEDDGISYSTWRRIATGQWLNDGGGAPKQTTIDKIVHAWGLDKAEPYMIMGWSLVTIDDVPAPPRDAPTRAAEKIFRLLAAPDEIVSPARKRRIDRQLEGIYENDRAEAIEEGWPTLDDGPSKEDGTA